MLGAADRSELVGRSPLAGPRAAVGAWWKRRDLVVQFTLRDIRLRTRGTALGFLWSFLQPLLLLSVFTVVFSVVLKIRWTDMVNEPTKVFALKLYAGFLIYEVVASSMSTAPDLVVSNSNLVKKVVFPLAVLPLSSVLAASFFGLANLLVLLVATLALTGSLPLTAVWAPLTAAPVIALAYGVSSFVAAIGVYVRDVRPFVASFLVLVLMYCSPIFYPLDRVPEQLQIILQLNPLTPIIEQTRGALWGSAPDLGRWTLSAGVCVVLAAGGHLVFRALKEGFADAL